MNICIYGASSNELDKKYLLSAEELGKKIAVRGHGLVFGGGIQGLMGAVFRGVSGQGNFTLGVAPKFFDKPGILCRDCSEFIFTDNMRQRKEIMETHSDAFIMVPGGIGTLEEFFEILTLKQLNRLNKPVAVFNAFGYYDDLQKMLQHAVKEKFMKPACRNIYGVFSDADALLDYIEKEASAPIDLRHLKNR